MREEEQLRKNGEEWESQCFTAAFGKLCKTETAVIHWYICVASKS